MLYHLLIVTQEESFGIDSVGVGPFSPGEACAENLKILFGKKKTLHSVTFRWSSVIRCLMYNKPRVNCNHSYQEAEHTRQLLLA
jgi:hypothetical protein